MPHPRFLPAGTSRRAALAALGGATWALTGLSAHAQAAGYPNRLIRIVPFGAGGGPIDSIARLYADKLQQRFGQPLIVDPKPGASGTLAADAVAKAPADGYTILVTLSLTHINNAILQTRLPYDPLKDFAPLTQIATGGPMLIARANAPFSTVREFAAYAKAHPGASYGSWGIGSTAHLFGELLKRQAGLDLVHVPYKAEAAAHNDLFGDQLTVSWANPATARALSQAGRVKVLGITGSKRVGTLPQVATFTEQGFAGFDLDSWIGAYVPAKTPPAVIDTLSSALRDITRAPDVRARLADFGFEPMGNTPAEFLANYKADYPRVAELIKAAGVTPE